MALLRVHRAQRRARVPVRELRVRRDHLVEAGRGRDVLVVGQPLETGVAVDPGPEVQGPGRVPQQRSVVGEAESVALAAHLGRADEVVEGGGVVAEPRAQAVVPVAGGDVPALVRGQPLPGRDAGGEVEVVDARTDRRSPCAQPDGAVGLVALHDRVHGREPDLARRAVGTGVGGQRVDRDPGGRGTIQVFSTGYFSTTCWPRKVIALTSWTGRSRDQRGHEAPARVAEGDQRVAAQRQRPEEAGLGVRERRPSNPRADRSGRCSRRRCSTSCRRGSGRRARRRSSWGWSCRSRTGPAKWCRPGAARARSSGAGTGVR